MRTRGSGSGGPRPWIAAAALVAAYALTHRAQRYELGDRAARRNNQVVEAAPRRDPQDA
jgi:hypothetical protein